MFGGKKLQKGDTVFFLRGDTFYVTRFTTPTNLKMYLNFNTSTFTTNIGGGNVITFMDYGNANMPKPVFRGTVKMSQIPQGSVSQQGNMVKISNLFIPNTNYVVTRIYYKNKPLVLARFPNDTTLFIDSVKSGSTYSIYCSYLSNVPDNFVDSSIIWVPTDGTSYGITNAINKSASCLRLSPGNFAIAPAKGNRFYLENKITFLDKTGEWFFNKKTDSLYILLPTTASGTFNPNDYEIQFVINTGTTPTSYDACNLFRMVSTNSTYYMSPTPISDIVFKNLAFERAEKAFDIHSIKNVTVTQCEFKNFSIAIDCWISDNVHINYNNFFDNEWKCIQIKGKTSGNYCEGNPQCYCKNIYVEHNLFKRHGLYGTEHRWRSSVYNNPLTSSMSPNYYSQKVIHPGPALENVFVRYNRVDSISDIFIEPYNYTKDQVVFASLYNGQIPFIIEKNYITNYCMDFRDCGCIKATEFLNNGIIRKNILVKNIHGNDNSPYKKKWTSLAQYKTHFAGNGCGLYTDYYAHKVIFEENTSIGGDVNGVIYPSDPSGSYAKFNVYKKNIFYGSSNSEFNMTHPKNSLSVDSNEVVENLFFHLRSTNGCIKILDASENNKVDSLWILNKNRYFTPNFSPTFIHSSKEWSSIGYYKVYGLKNTKQKTNYESSPISYWGTWAKYKYWNSSNIILAQYINNPTFTTTPYPFSTFGGASAATVAISPFNSSCYRVVSPNPATSGAGISSTGGQPLYTQTLSPHDVYKITLIAASNKAKEYRAQMEFKSKHPNTGEVFDHWSSGKNPDFFVFPFKSAYTPDTFMFKFTPLFFQYNNVFKLYTEKNDTLWIKKFSIEKVDTNTLKPDSYYYPIFINPSDQIKTYTLNPCHVYLDTDSNMVISTVTVAPWSSRILIYQKCDSTLLSTPSEKIQQRNNIIVYPNPVNDELFVMNGVFVKYTIIDIKGAVIASGQIEPGHHSINVNNLSKGIYLIQTIRNLPDGKIEKQTFKFLKE
jgi:hypothetical protein